MIENFLDALSGSPTLLVGLCVLMGLLVGSFLNVVIYRLPVMMERGWKQEAREILELPPEEDGEIFNLVTPAPGAPSVTMPLPGTRISRSLAGWY